MSFKGYNEFDKVYTPDLVNAYWVFIQIHQTLPNIVSWDNFISSSINFWSYTVSGRNDSLLFKAYLDQFSCPGEKCKGLNFIKKSRKTLVHVWKSQSF